MAYNVLVMGGSYFLGRIFCIFASRREDMELTLVNRGRYAMTHYPHLREYRSDRHDADGLARLPEQEYDAAVDLCAYAPGDVSFLLDHLPGTVKRYILISTADVYMRRPGVIPEESSPLQDAKGTGPAAEYIWNKVLLERELETECIRRGIEPVILRPAFIYGPYNYAPRESWYIRRIVQGLEIPVPSDASSRFQFVFVKDAAEAILACVTRPVTAAQVLEENIPVPFPLTEEESELYRGDRITRELGLSYTPFPEGMEKTWKAFKSVYQ